MNMKIKSLLLSFVILVPFTSCEKEEGCDDCGGDISDGYFFNEVTPEDLIVLGAVEVEVGACIRYKLDGTEFDLETVMVVDDCCCEQ